MRVMCLKHRIIIVIIIFSSLGQILSSYILKKNHHTRTCTYAHTRTRTCARTHTRARARTHTHMHMHTHAHAHARARTHTHTHTHKTTDAWVIIPQPFVSSCEFINSCCRHFDLLLFRGFDSIYRRYDRSRRRSGCRRCDLSLAINY